MKTSTRGHLSQFALVSMVSLLLILACALPIPTAPQGNSRQAVDRLEQAEDQEDIEAAINDIVCQVQA